MLTYWWFCLYMSNMNEGKASIWLCCFLSQYTKVNYEHDKWYYKGFGGLMVERCPPFMPFVIFVLQLLVMPKLGHCLCLHQHPANIFETFESLWTFGTYTNTGRTLFTKIPFSLGIFDLIGTGTNQAHQYQSGSQKAQKRLLGTQTLSRLIHIRKSLWGR